MTFKWFEYSLKLIGSLQNVLFQEQSFLYQFYQTMTLEFLWIMYLEKEQSVKGQKVMIDYSSRHTL